jgi:hypothetical protein
MNNSPFSRIGARLVDQGFSAIPVLPGTKRPGSYSKGRWWGDIEWNRFCDRLPTTLEIEIWEKWPDAGVCVALGLASGGLVAVDIDTDNQEIVKAIESAIPEESPVQKMGRKGRTLFYRARPAVVSTAYNVHGERVLDLLAHGKQTILPPTVHPDTGRPYEWLTASTLEHITTDRLPLLPDDIAARLGAALAPHGYYAPVERPAASEGGGLWREINEVALTRFADWVPALGIDAKRAHNGTWRGRAIWKGAENANVGFSPQGIKDWGDDRGMTALDVVMESHSVDFPTAEKWLRERLGFKDPEPVKFVFRKPQKADPLPADVEVPLGAPEAEVDPFDFGFAGGLLRQTAHWIYSESFVPSLELSMLAALGIMSAFMGRRYVGPSGLAPNLYLVGLAGTGEGKDVVPFAVKNILLRGGGMDHMLGAGDLSSDAAIERIVRFKPGSVSPMDEIGAWLQEGAGRNSPQYAKNRRKTLLELYGNSKVGGIYLGKDKAGSETLSSSEPIFSPCFSIAGVSTQDLFFKGLTEENTVDGFLNRLTVIEIKKGGVRNRKMSQKAGIPSYLKEAYDAAFEAWPCPPAHRKSYRGALMDPFLYPVPWADEAAEKRWDAVWDWQERMIEEATHTAGLVKRTAEQTIKLAMIRAVSRDFAAPAITVEDVKFGEAIVFKSVTELKEGMRRYMSGSEFEDNCKTLLRAVEGFPKGLTETELTRRAGVSKIDSRRLKEAIDWLSKTGRWRPIKKKRGFRYMSLNGLEAVEEDDEE